MSLNSLNSLISLSHLSHLSLYPHPLWHRDIVTKVTPALAPRNQPTEHSRDDKVFEKKLSKYLTKGIQLLYICSGNKRREFKELREVKEIKETKEIREVKEVKEINEIKEFKDNPP